MTSTETPFQPTSVDLRQQRERVVTEMRTLTETAERQSRNLNTDERPRFDAAETRFRQLTEQIEAAEAAELHEAENAVPLRRTTRADDGTQSGGRLPWHRSSSRDAVLLRSDQTLSQHVHQRGYRSQSDLGLGRMLRGLATGDWIGAEAEQRALSETPTAGGVLVPTPVSSRVLDLARAQARVFQAGASTVPMESSTLKMGRQTGDPALSWHSEGDTITESNLTFDAITLQAHTLPCLMRASLELLEDVENIDTIVERSMAAAMALELDRVALLGSGTAPEPLGLRGTSGITVSSAGTDGAPPSWNLYARAAGSVRTANFDPNGIIHHPRSETDLTLTTATDGQYLNPPATLAGVPRFDTTQIPVTNTQGTATDASEAFVGQWDQLLVGMRTTFTIRPLVERYVDTGEIGFFAYLRADIAVAHPEAFTVITGLTPAA